MTTALTAHSHHSLTGSRGLAQVGVEQLLALSQHLATADRALLHGVYERGMSPHALATASGLDPRSVQARLRRLRRRMASPIFRYVVNHRDRWSADRKAIAGAVVLQGQTQRSVASQMNLSVYQVRREIDRIKAMSEAMER